MAGCHPAPGDLNEHDCHFHPRRRRPAAQPDQVVQHDLPDRDVGALRLLRHGGAAGAVHGAEARLRRRQGQPDLGRVHRAGVRRAGDRRLDRRQGPRRPAQHDDRRHDPRGRLPAAVGAVGQPRAAVRRARRDRGRQRPVQVQRRQPRPPHLRRRRRQDRQRVHAVLHGRQHRLDVLDARHAGRGREVGLARGVRGVLRGHGAGIAQLRTDAPHARPRRLGAGRRADQLGQARPRARHRRGAGVRGVVRAAARSDRTRAGVAGRRGDPGDLRLPHREERARRALRPGGGADPDHRDDPVLHLLPADVDVADAVRAAQRRAGTRRCSACTCSPGSRRNTRR